MKKKLQWTNPLKINAAAGEGKPKRFEILAYSGGLLPVDNFQNPVVVDLAGLQIVGNVPILLDHEKSVNATLGFTDLIENDGKSIRMSGKITGSGAAVDSVLTAAAAGHDWQASIGCLVQTTEEIPAGQTVTVNGQEFTGPVIVARAALLRETSVLPVGADPQTTVRLAAQAARLLKGSETMDFSAWLESMGIDPSKLTSDDLAAMQLAYETKTKAAAPPVPAAAAPAAAPVPSAPILPTAAGVKQMDIQASMADYRKTMAVEQRRIAEIQAKAAGHPMICAKAIEEGWSTDKVELEVLRTLNARTRVTSFSTAQNSPENIGQVLEAAVCMNRRISNVEKQFDDKTLQAAHSQFRGGVGLQQVIILAAQASGMSIPVGFRISSTSAWKQIVDHVRGQNLNAAFSTVSLPGILGNVANKELLQGYMEDDQTWREVAVIKSVSDFKTVTSYRLLDNMTYEKLGAGGKIKGGTIGEESYTRQADTYAKMFSLTRQDIINDDLGAFDDLRSRLGRGSARKLREVFWTTFLSNASTFWTTAKTNYIEGATTNLGTDGVGLGLAVKAYRTRTSPSADGGKRLGGMAKTLLVPPELETTADLLYTARNVGNVKVSDGNTHAGKYAPIVATELSDSAYTGYSATAFYLLGDKGEVGSPVVVSFLNGQESPTVETSDADFDTLGVQFRGYHDFGCDQAEYLAGIKSKGAA